MRFGQWQFLEREVIADGPDGPLLIRYKIVKGPLFGICVHKLCRSDYDRALHDHPWWFISLVLSGGYIEVHQPDPGRKNQRIGTDGLVWVWRAPWSIAHRPAEWRHRVIIPAVVVTDVPDAMRRGRPAWTLVLMGPRVRKWGFWIDSKWCWWRRHDSARNICSEEIVHSGGGD